MYDRVMQAYHALALDLGTETRSDRNSYGFKRGRCAQDARKKLFISLARKGSPAWVLEEDIKGCFDNISHE